MLQGVWLFRQPHLKVDVEQISGGILTQISTTYGKLSVALE